jgi:hypothetical protein
MPALQNLTAACCRGMINAFLFLFFSDGCLRPLDPGILGPRFMGALMLLYFDDCLSAFFYF